MGIVNIVAKNIQVSKNMFGCFYRSPTSTTASDQNNDKLNNLLRHMTQKNYSHISSRQNKTALCPKSVF